MKPVWEDHLHSLAIYHGDVLEFTEPLTADILITDPPYSRAGGQHTGRHSTHGMSDDARQSDQFWLHWFSAAAKRFLSNLNERGCGFIFCDYRTIGSVERAISSADMGWIVSQCLVWDRESIGMGSPFRSSHELIAFIRGPKFEWTGRRDMGNVLRHRWFYGAHEHHPAEKPVGLLRELIQLLPPSDAIVFDPFMGSGSTLVAAQSCGRRGFGIEIEGAHIDTAVQRLQQQVLVMT
jgi:site-specific DNA-methyltransferase (adenine-specific)